MEKRIGSFIVLPDNEWANNYGDVPKAREVCHNVRSMSKLYPEGQRWKKESYGGPQDSSLRFIMEKSTDWAQRVIPTRAQTLCIVTWLRITSSQTTTCNKRTVHQNHTELHDTN